MPASKARVVAVAALQIALAYAAAPVREEGGNNRGDQVEFFQHLMGGAPGDPWCADFVCTCLVKGYARVNKLAEDRAHLPACVRAAGTLMVPLSGSCEGLEKAAVARYVFRNAELAEPLPGDLVLFDIPDRHGKRLGRPHHVGMVRAAFRDGKVLTVEGNTSSGVAGSQGDGDGVFLRERVVAGNVYGYVHFS